jgi:hypothetical protein
MASTCTVCKGNIQLGTGSVAAGSTSITSYSGTAPINGRNVVVSVTQAGTHAGRSFATEIISGSGTATLVVNDACPFVGA